MNIQSIDTIPIWLLLIMATSLFSIAAELGFRVGNHIHKRLSIGQNPVVSTVLGAALGLLAFFLAFTFSMAGSRYDARKQLVLDEANALETTYLRAKLLQEPYSTEFQNLLRQYVDARALLQTDQMEIVKQVMITSEELQNQLWSKLIVMTQNNTPSVITSLYINSLNEVFDLHGKRVNAGLRNRIPISIFLTLYFVTFLSMAMMGYQAGLVGRRTPIAGFVLILTFSIVLALITDLERPRQEIFSVNQQVMVELKNKVSPTP